MQRLTSGVRSYGRASRTYNKDVQAFAQSTRMLTDALEKALPTMQRVARSMNSIAESSKIARQNLSRFGSGFGRLTRQTQETNRAFNTTGRQTAALTHRFLQISGATRTLEGQFLSLGSAFLGGFGAAATVDLIGKAIGVIANTIGDSVQSAASLESRLAEIATISSDVAENMSGFADVLGDISVATRTDVGLLSEGFYQTISSGITNTSEALRFLEVSANAARAGLTTVEIAVDGLSSTINAFGFQAAEADDVADKFFKTVELGKLRFADLARGIGLVAPIAVELGVSLEELLAAGAALTSGGNTLRQSFTAVRGILNAVLRPAEKATNIAREMGLEFSVSALRTKGLAGFLRDLERQTGGNAEVLGQLIPRVEGLRGILALTGNQAEKFEQNLIDITNAAGSTDKAVDLINSTFQGQVDLLNQQLSRALRIVGEQLLPDVTDAVIDLSDALEDVNWDQFRRDVELTISVIKGFIGFLGQTYSLLANVAQIALRFTPAGAAGAGAFGTARNAFNNLRAIPPSDTSTGAFRAFEAGTGRPVAQQTTPVAQVVPIPQLTRAFPLTDPQQAQRNRALGVSNVITSANIAPGQRRPIGRPLQETGGVVGPTTRRPIIGGLQGRFLPPRAVPTAEVVRQPIPGVQGQLLAPGAAIPSPNAAGVFQSALGDATATELDNITTNTQRVSDVLEERLGPAQQSLDAIAQAQRDERLRPSVVPGTFDQTSGYVGFPQFQRQQQQMGVDDVLDASVNQLASNFSLVNAAIQGGTAGGLPGALIAVGTELLTMTEGFGRLQDSFNNVVEQLVIAIEPLVGALVNVLEPVFKALGDVAQALAPAFEVLGKILTIAVTPAAKALGFVLTGLSRAIEFIANIWVKIINGLIGLLNRLPFVDIQRIPEGNTRVRLQPIDEPQGSLAQDEANAERASRERTRGIQVSRITGPTRDIFVDLLRPLRQLDTTFPAMLDVLRNIETSISTRLPMAVPAGNMLPRQPNLGAFNAPQNNENTDLALARQGGFGGIFIDQFNIHVDQVTDLNVDQLQQQLLDNLDVRDRNDGGVFPNNR